MEKSKAATLMAVIFILLSFPCVSKVRSDGSDRRCNAGDQVPLYANKVSPFHNPRYGIEGHTQHDVIHLMNIGHRNRAVGATARNDRSSRSHSCLTIHVQGKDLTSGVIHQGCMHLVDLAGSERVDKSEVTGDRLKEAQHINRSLSALGDVIASLALKNSHVPYRNSKLTQLLQDSLGGQATTLMFVHISPEPDAVGETLGTLKFAERVATVELGATRVNKDGGADAKELKEQIASLKTSLARKEGDSSHSHLARGHSPFRSNPNGGNRQLTGDVSHIEVPSKSGVIIKIELMHASLLEKGDSLTVEQLLELLDEDSLRKGTALPSPEWSSDHIALMAEFRCKPRT